MKYLTVINPVHAEKTPSARELLADSILSWMNLLCEISPEYSRVGAFKASSSEGRMIEVKSLT